MTVARHRHRIATALSWLLNNHCERWCREIKKVPDILLQKATVQWYHMAKFNCTSPFSAAAPENEAVSSWFWLKKQVNNTQLSCTLWTATASSVTELANTLIVLTSAYFSAVLSRSSRVRARCTKWKLWIRPISFTFGAIAHYFPIVDWIAPMVHSVACG